MEIAEIQIIQKMMLKNKISIPILAARSGIAVSKLRGLLEQKGITTQDKIDTITRNVMKNE